MLTIVSSSFSFSLRVRSALSSSSDDDPQSASMVPDYLLRERELVTQRCQSFKAFVLISSGDMPWRKLRGTVRRLQRSSFYPPCRCMLSKAS